MEAYSRTSSERQALTHLEMAELSAARAQLNRQRDDMSPPDLVAETAGSGDATTQEFFDHSTARRINTDVIISAALARQYPSLELVVTPAGSCNLLGYARAGFASYEEVHQDPAEGGALPSSLVWDAYIPPARRLDGGLGGIGQNTLFGKYLYKWKTIDFIVYLVDGRDGSSSYPKVENYYILTPSRAQAQRLILEAGRWAADLHDEVWVFDSGYWQKSRELFDSVRHASWDAVILDPAMKRALIDDHLSFFGSRDTYTRLRVPWKRGIIYHGPPGNGKTISIKAMMHTLYEKQPAIPTLYVRSLTSFSGPEYSIKLIFNKAREYAPCYLVFEDLDSVINDRVRSYFLNEVDGLKSNDGIFMVGSTNHLDRLDPGISKRPSRFDRKYYFPNPNLAERTAYCRFWQRKLSDNKDIEFPDELCGAIAAITDDFSFAYMQEAFVAALLAIARQSGSSPAAAIVEEEDLEEWDVAGEDVWVGVTLGGGDRDDDDLDGLVLWIEIKKQIKTLREGMEKEKEK